MYVKKPQLVAKHVVPAAFAMLNNTKAEERAASTQLLSCLAELMGGQLLEKASNLAPAVQQRIRDIVARS